MYGLYSWPSVENFIILQPANEEIEVRRDQLPNPHENGYKLTVGEPRGQLYDLEKTNGDGSRIHVSVFERMYRIHLDKFSPIIAPIQHLRHDSPHYWVLGCTALGAGLCADEEDPWSSIIGAGIGFLFGALTLPQGKKTKSEYDF